jgi:hypothetical protein
MTVYGYARVSGEGQSLTAQVAELAKDSGHYHRARETNGNKVKRIVLAGLNSDGTFM